MVKIPRRQTLLKVYRNILRKVASLSVVSMLLANTYLPYFALVPQIAHADAPPELSVSYDKNTNDLEIKINTSSKINYLISYSHEKNGDVVLEGLQGNGDDSSGVYSKKFYLGTCSANDCVRHNIKRAVVQAYIKDLGWAREQRFVFELNLDLSLVGKTAIDVKDDMLELSTENENWLKDIDTVVPSLTPTATQGPTATPIVSQTATPTPSVVVETPTITPVIVETATPTTVPTGTVASLNEEVSVELVESVEPEPSLIDTIVSALLPFLGTDKSDYAPTEKAVITGSSFLPNTEYSITISSADEPPVSHTDKVMTTATGTFTYEYQLDGTYRPNYAVEVRDDSGIVVATTTFTDTPPAADSCGNNILESGEECDGSDLGVLSNVDFVCKNNCTLDLVTPKVTICHASSSQSNPYISQEPNKSSDVNGHDNHTGGVWYTGIPDSSWGDIIPPFAYIGGTYPGKNWTTEGQAIWNNKCNYLTGTVVVHKDVRGPAGIDVTDTSSNFSIQLDGTDTKTVTDKGTVTYENVPVGSHVVTELTPPTGYVVWGISTVAGSSGNDTGLTVNVSKDQTTNVYVTNWQQSGNIVVYKDVRKANGDDVVDNHNFSVQLDGANDSVFSESSPTSYSVNPGTHTISELVDSDYTNKSCKLASGASATDFVVAPGAELAVTCTNYQKNISASCGDGTVNQRSEICDDGNQNNDDYCNNQCQPNENVCLPDVNMVSNGDFETPVVTSGSKWDIFNIFTPYIGWIPTWLSGTTLYGGDTRPDLANIELHRGVNGWASASGSQHTELDSDWMGPADSTSGEPASVSLSQKLMTIPGYKYEVKFAYSPRPGAAASDNQMQFKFGANSESYGPTSSGGVSWNTVTKTYTADSSQTDISFSDIGNANSEGMFLDNVSVKCLGPVSRPVTVCKTDVSGKPLSGWNLILSGREKVGEDLTLDTHNPAGVTVSSLTAGEYYQVEISGTWNNGNIETRDAFYGAVGVNEGKLDPVNTGVYDPRIVKVVLDDTPTTLINFPSIWGAYTNAHSYTAIYKTIGTSLNVRLWDFPIGSSDTGWYGDNRGNLTVRIYKLTNQKVSELTGDDGCATIPSLNEGSYYFSEVPNSGWQYASGGGDITVGENSTKFTIVNKPVEISIPKTSVMVCKVDQDGKPLSGWKVGLSQPTGFNELIPVTNGDGINANLAESGAYVVYASGTYRYGNSAMIADAGYSYRPVGIPYGTDGWVSGDDLLSVPGALELKVGGQNIQWGGFNAGHAYSTYLPGQPAGNLNLAIWDDNYGDNVNNGNFRASIDKQKYAGFVGENGCATFTDVPYGDYHIFEAPRANWSYISTTVGSKTFSNYPATVTVGDNVPEITLKNRFAGTGIIRIVKDVMPDDKETKFDYNLKGPNGYDKSDKVWEGNSSVEINLLPGEYTLSETDLPGYVESISCSNQAASATNSITFSLANAEDVTCTLTNSIYGSFAGKKYIDQNGNGQYDAGDTLYAGWTIELYKHNGESYKYLTETTTDANGAYSFSNLVSGMYKIAEKLNNGYVATDPNSSGLYNGVNLSPGENLTGYDFGNFEKGDMDVWKYEDIDDVLGKSSEEKYIGNPTFTFRVYKNVDSIWTKVGEADTDIDGKATFTNVFDTVGNYFVCEVKKTGWEEMRSRKNPANNLSGETDEYPVCDGITVSTSGYSRQAEFGNIQKGKVVVYKFHDLNADGKRNEGEPLMSDWSIFMDKEGDGGVTEQTTGADGSTEFALNSGTYVLGETQKEGWYQSNIYCEDQGEGVKITRQGYAFGHHGACSGWNQCGDAKTCALKACQAKGYSNLVSYGDQKPCTQFNNCSLFYDINSSLNYQENWGNWCNVMGVTDIVCSSAVSSTPTPTPPQAGLFDKLLGVNQVIAQEAPTGNTKVVTVSPGDRKSCYVGNYQKGTVTVNKNVISHIDKDIADSTKFEVSGGEALGTKNFSEVSPAVFTINPGTYNFEEINISKQYTLKEILGDENTDMENAQVTVASGGSASITFVNQKVKPKLTIRKFNDKWPNVQNTGSNILYSIVVKILDNDMQDVSMIDLPPEGFRYQSGSWKAYKNGLPYGVSEPVYSSPGTWYLGDLLENDEVLLTYTAKIDNGTGPGLYKDMAWAYGCSDTENCEVTSEDMLLASSVDSTKTDPGIITDTVVGTKIEIPRTGTQSKAINIVEKREGQVLGASDVRLPATGANDWVLVTGLGSIFTGLLFGLIYFARKRMKKISARFVTGVLAFLLFAFLTSGVEAANLTVRINEPKSPTYDSFDLGFVALDIMNRPVTARCYIKNTNNGGSYTQFDGDKLLKAGGDSEICKVTTGLLTSGSNKFKVEAAADGDTAVSQEVNVDFTPSSSGPWKPKSYGRNDVSDCSTEVSFATADDGGRTVRVEIYRSTETSFTLNDSTKVTSIDVGSGQSKTYTDNVPDCAKTYYYAIRAFDSANNPSEHIGDSIITVINSTSTSNTTSASGSTSGAIEVIGGSGIPQGGTSGQGQILGEGTGLTGDISGTPSVSPMVTGEVLGEEESTPTGSLTETVKDISNTRGLWFIIGFLLVAAGAGVFAYYKWTGAASKK